MKVSLLLCLLACLIISSPAWSQETGKGFTGLLNQISVQQQTYRWTLSPIGGISLQRHQLSAGPVIFMADFSGAVDYLPRLTGLQLHYRYFLSSNQDKDFRVFAEFISKAQRIKESWTSNYWNEQTQQYLDAQQGSKELLWQNFAGIGAQYSFHPRLFLQLSTGVGYSLSGLTRTGISPDSSDALYDYRPYDERTMAFAMSLGIYLSLGQ